MAGIRWDLPGAGTPGFPKDSGSFCKDFERGFLRWILARLWPFFVGRGTVSSRFSCGVVCLMWQEAYLRDMGLRYFDSVLLLG